MSQFTTRHAIRAAINHNYIKRTKWALLSGCCILCAEQLYVSFLVHIKLSRIVVALCITSSERLQSAIALLPWKAEARSPPRLHMSQSYLIYMGDLPTNFHPRLSNIGKDIRIDRTASRPHAHHGLRIQVDSEAHL